MKYLKITLLATLVLSLTACIDWPQFKTSMRLPKDKVLQVPEGTYSMEEGDAFTITKRDGRFVATHPDQADENEIAYVNAYKGGGLKFWEFEVADLETGNRSVMLFLLEKKKKDRIILKAMDSDKARSLFTLDEGGDFVTNDPQAVRAIIRDNAKELFVEELVLVRRP